MCSNRRNENFYNDARQRAKKDIEEHSLDNNERRFEAECSLGNMISSQIIHFKYDNCLN